jgi:alpha-glucosidase
MPTLYTAFIDAAETGLPTQRPLIIDYKNDAVAREIGDQYLVGENILVAPVYTEGTTAREVYLPAGGWRHWFTGEHIAGGRYVVAKTPMENIPMYVRDGAVIPMWPEAPKSTVDYHPSAIELHLFVPVEDGIHVSHLQEDDGMTYAYRDGRCYRTTMSLERNGDLLSFAVETSGEGYPQFARHEFAIIFHGASPTEVEIGSKTYTVHDGVVVVPNSGESFSLTARIGDGKKAHRRNVRFELAAAPGE